MQASDTTALKGVARSLRAYAVEIERAPRSVFDLSESRARREILRAAEDCLRQAAGPVLTTALVGDGFERLDGNGGYRPMSVDEVIGALGGVLDARGMRRVADAIERAITTSPEDPA